MIARTSLSACLLLGLPLLARAQAGPPMLTNDTGSPGNGHWEINLAASGDRTDGAWSVAAPDMDINYGLGERIQLSLHAGWNHLLVGRGAQSGLSELEWAARWRFLETGSGFTMAVQPQWITPGPRRSIGKGLSAGTQEFVLPLQMVQRLGEHDAAGMELARHWIAHGGDAWQAGVFYAHDCPHRWDCIAEINSQHEIVTRTATVVNFGARHPITPHVLFMGSLGRQIAGVKPQAAPVFYLGVQVLSADEK